MQSSLEEPKKTDLNWFIPAFVKRIVGSSCGIVGEEVMILWSRSLKKFKNCLRSRAVFISFFSLAKFSFEVENIA